MYIEFFVCIEMKWNGGKKELSSCGDRSSLNRLSTIIEIGTVKNADKPQLKTNQNSLSIYWIFHRKWVMRHSYRWTWVRKVIHMEPAFDLFFSKTNCCTRHLITWENSFRFGFFPSLSIFISGKPQNWRQQQQTLFIIVVHFQWK